MFSSNVILTPGRLAETVAYFRSEPEGLLSFDMETSGDDRGVPYCNNASWIGLAARGRTAVIPFGHPLGTKIVEWTKEPRVLQDHKNGGTVTKMFKVPVYEPPPPQLGADEVFAALRPLFFDSGKTLIGHGMQFDLATIAKYFGGEIPPGPHCDSIVLRWLIDENRHEYKLKAITRDIYGYAYDDEEVGKKVEAHPFNKVAHYLHCDVLFPLYEYWNLRPLVAEWDLERIYEIEMALLPILARMRLTGINVDRDRLEEMRADLGPKVEQVEAKIYQAAGRKFNLNATRQKCDVLYGPKSEGGQGLKPWRLTKGGKNKQRADRSWTPGRYDWSTDAEALESYEGNPVVDAILNYQEWAKLLNTYVIGYLGDPDAKDKPCQIYDGKIFADFVQYGAKTGRFSCREPNLQNVGRPGTELGTLIRGAFIAEPGRRLVVADYDQIELVMLAHFLGQGKLYEGFLAGIDPHRMTAAGATGKHPDDVTADERQKLGKSLNFAIVFGAGDNKTASMMGVHIDRARQFQENHRMEFPEIYDYKEYILEQCRSDGYVRTLLGRCRRLPGINSRDRGMRMYSERQAFNAHIQGSAADIMKLAMIRLAGDMPPWMQLHLTVHDELVTSSPIANCEEAKGILLNAMTGPGIKELIRVPLKSDCAIVKRWSEAK